MKFPDFILNAPELHPGLGLYYQAFWALSTTRSIGMDYGPIPWTAIQEYARWWRLDEEQTDSLHYHLSEMDKVFLAHRGAKNA